jgi:hypothetical protein
LLGVGMPRLWHVFFGLLSARFFQKIFHCKMACKFPHSETKFSYRTKVLIEVQSGPVGRWLKGGNKRADSC